MTAVRLNQHKKLHVGVTVALVLISAAVGAAFAQGEDATPVVTPTPTAVEDAPELETDVFGVCYQTTNVRTGPDTRFAIIGQLSEGDRVPITGRDGASRWLRVVLNDGTEGWLPAFAVIVEGDLTSVPVATLTDVDQPNEGATVEVVSYGRVNVRSGPGVEYDILAQMNVNDTAEAVARSSRNNDWLLIRFEGVEGWVAYFTVNVTGDVRTLPVLVPDSSGDALIPPSALIRSRFNVRLHTEPALASPVTTLVPFNSEVTPIGRSADNAWLFVGYEGATGWGAAQLFDITLSELRTLPIYERTLTVTPTPTTTN